jgi:sodium/hydrogen exchanger-like protein 3
MRDMYKYMDTKYIKPCLLRENQYRDPKIIETFENLTNKDAVEFMKRNPTQFAGLKSLAGNEAASSGGGLSGMTSSAGAILSS